MSFNPLPSSVSCVAGRFPGDIQLVIRLAVESEDFRSICEDLALAVETLRQLDKQDPGKDSATTLEYRALVQELDQEIERVLARHRRL
jgi:hypothetical protein